MNTGCGRSFESPGGRYAIRTGAWEARMSHWVYPPALFETQASECLYQAQDTNWSLDAAVWESDSVVRMELGKYSGGVGMDAVVRVDCAARSAELDGVALPLAELDAALARKVAEAGSKAPAASPRTREEARWWSGLVARIRRWFGRWQETRGPGFLAEAQVLVQFDEAGIAATYPDGTKLAIAWAEVGCIAIETNDSGPWGADLWWHLEGAGKRCSYPGGATGEREALAGFPEHFPGFSHEAVIAAMGSTSNARFVCWQRG